MCVIYVIGRDLLCLASLRLGLVRLNSVCKLIHIAISAMFISKIFFIYQDGIPVLLNFQWLIVVISFRVLPLARVGHTSTTTAAVPNVRSTFCYILTNATNCIMKLYIKWTNKTNFMPIKCHLYCCISSIVFLFGCVISVSTWDFSLSIHMPR